MTINKKIRRVPSAYRTSSLSETVGPYDIWAEYQDEILVRNVHYYSKYANMLKADPTVLKVEVLPYNAAI